MSALAVSYLALDASGRIGAFAVQKGFQYAVKNGERDEIIDAASAY